MNMIYLFKPFRELDSITSGSCESCLSCVADDFASEAVGCERFAIL